ncbi:MAG TPA: class I SAM-dependent methyltransferase [Dehalococcoidia bacterium]|nr:class I SAM-dependent methyltransferase [Dehalococcoidia bacterium]
MTIVEPLLPSLRPVSCDLCGLDDARVVLAESESNIVQCNACGLVYFNPQPSADALARYYTSDSDEAYTRALQGWYGQLNPQAISSLTHDLNVLEQKLFRHSHGGLREADPVRYLEVGCAFGYQLYCARLKGWETVGIELSRPMAEWAGNELGLNVICGTIEDEANGLPDGRFDLILMSHVIEHVPQPTASVRAAYRLLKPGGVLALYMPNAGGIQARHDFGTWEWKVFPDHLYYFSPVTLRLLLTKCGFDVEEVWSCLGESNHEQVLNLIQTQLHLDSQEQALQMAEVLGPLCMLSDLRAVARKPEPDAQME